jgi:1,4-alpha-glucan branching enzyme
MTILREEFHRVVDQLHEQELAPLLDYVRSHAHPAVAESPVWDGPDFIGAFSSGRSDISEHGDEMLFTEGPADGADSW